MTTTTTTPQIDGVRFANYHNETQLECVMNLVGRDLSEPYSIFTYRYFLHRYPDLCILAMDERTDEAIGCIVGKIDNDDKPNGQDKDNNLEEMEEEEGIVDALEGRHHQHGKAGYIGMLAVDKAKRRLGIGKALVSLLLERFFDKKCESVTLETEVSNIAAQKLYQEIFGFLREELLVRYYLNWGDAYRLRLWFCNHDHE